MAKTLVLGTRGSDLALAQADMVTAALRLAHPDLEIRREIIRTVGDKRPGSETLRFQPRGCAGR